MPSEVICSEAENLKEFCYQMHAGVNSLTPMSYQDRISPYNINTIINQICDENKEKYQFRDN